MLKVGGDIELSASDLVGHLNCRYLTDLDLAVANGQREKPKHWDPFLKLLQERGAIHEKAFLDHLRSEGYQVFEVEGIGTDQALVDQTTTAMRAGAEIIVQGAFRSDGWVGRTDILKRAETRSDLGDWSYEVIDTKLSRETKGGTLLQLSLYSDLVAAVQGRMPDQMHVVAPWSEYKPQSFRTADYAAFYRKVADGLKQSVGRSREDVNYPDPKEHCDVCRWRVPCYLRRRTDDHLCLVAGISKVQINELHRQGINTVSNLAQMAVPLSWKPERGAVYSYERLREQARIQIEGREAKTILYEALPRKPGFARPREPGFARPREPGFARPRKPGFGLSCLPTPSAGDVFFDIEGDPFVGEHGLEYLFGYCFSDDSGEMRYVGEWALSREEEKSVCEHFIDFVIERLAAFPDLHVYHYAPYEPAALKRLTLRYGTRGDELDQMLRTDLFVDLYSVVKNGILASVESYSIKRLEPLYDYIRSMELSNANSALANLQAALELNDFDRITKENRDVVKEYNRDDCLSTHGLRNWLERVRTKLIEGGETIDRPVPDSGAPSERVTEWTIRINDVIRRIRADIPVDQELRSEEQQSRWTLANVLDWHRREEKAAWWEYFRLRDRSAEELFEERAGLSGLEFVENLGGTAKAPIHRYRYPAQETELRGGKSLRRTGGAEFGSIVSISLDDRTVEIKKRMDSAGLHPEAVFAATKKLSDRKSWPIPSQGWEITSRKTE